MQSLNEMLSIKDEGPQSRHAFWWCSPKRQHGTQCNFHHVLSVKAGLVRMTFLGLLYSMSFHQQPLYLFRNWVVLEGKQGTANLISSWSSSEKKYIQTCSASSFIWLYNRPWRLHITTCTLQIYFPWFGMRWKANFPIVYKCLHFDWQPAEGRALYLLEWSRFNK